MEMLRSVAEEVATLPGGPAACMAMGVLVDRLRRRRAGRAARVHGRLSPSWSPATGAASSKPPFP